MTDPRDLFFTSAALERVLRAHLRLRRLESLERPPEVFVEDFRAHRDKALDQLLELFPREVVSEDIGPDVTLECVLRAFRDEVLIDLCRAPSGRAMIGSSVSIALRSRWPKARLFGEPKEPRPRVELEDLDTLAEALGFVGGEGEEPGEDELSEEDLARLERVEKLLAGELDEELGLDQLEDEDFDEELDDA